MKISFDIPKGFLGCGVTMMYEDAQGFHMYSTTITPDEVGGEKVLTIPRKEKDDANNA